MRILLLSEATLCVNAGGISQTLYNIFSFCKPEDILCVAPRKEIISQQPSPLFKKSYIGYSFEIFSLPSNRVTQKLKPIIDWINFSINQHRHFRKIKRHIEIFNPDVAVCCPNGLIGALVHEKLFSTIKCPIFPYFMDDWMGNQKIQWMGGDLQSNIKALLTKNRNWLMISNELSTLLSGRYNTIPLSVLPIRNPVSLNGLPLAEPLRQKKKYLIAYAGALWPMHFDSFCIVSEAVQKLSFNIDIEMVIYCGEHYWNWRKQTIVPLGVKYGGNIPYEQIHEKLSGADLLLVVSSFDKALFTHSKASIQTKITDYFKAQRLIISCGPEYSANHTFLKENECGICLESDNVDAVSQKISSILDTIVDYQYMVENGLNLLQTQFNFDVVQQKLKSFLKPLEIHA